MRYCREVSVIQLVVQGLSLMRVSLTEQMDGCPIREGENTGNVIYSVANTKKNFSPDNVIYMCLFLLI